MKFTLVLLFLITFTAALMADDASEPLFFCCFPETMPEFPGGERAMMQFLSEHIEIPCDLCFSGKVIAQFTVEPDGSITCIKILKYVCSPLEKQVVLAIGQMPCFKHGTQLGKTVATRITLPVKFSMD